MVIMANNIKIVAVGANMESQRVLEVLFANNVKIEALFTTPIKKKSKGSDYHDLRQLCDDNSIAVFDITSINSQASVNKLLEIKPDYIYVLGWSELLSDKVLDIPKHYVVGSHPSDLPYGAGRAPIPWTILEDLSRSAVTLFEMKKTVDSGDIILKKYFKIPKYVTANKLYEIVSETLAACFLQVHNQILNKNVVFKKQKTQNRFIRAKRIWQDGYIDFNKSVNEIERLIRAVTSPYPGAFTYYKGERVIVWSANLHGVSGYKGSPGQILKISGENYLVQCGDFPMWLEDIEFGNKQNKEKPKLGNRFGINFHNEILKLKTEIALIKGDD